MGTARRVFLAAALLAVAACSSGGGGGGGGGGDFGDGGLVVTPRALTYTYVIGGLPPPAQAISASWTASADAFGAFLPPGVSAPPWLPTHPGDQQVSADPVSRTGTVQLHLTADGVTPGVSTVEILVGIGQVQGNVLSPIAYRGVTVTYVVKTFGADTTAVSSSFVLGSSVPPPSRSVTVSAAGSTAWTASSSQPWILLDGAATAAGTTPSTVTIGFDPTGLATGTHTGTVTFAGAGTTDAVPVILTIAAPTLAANPGSVDLAGLGGHDLSPKTVQVSLDTGTNAHAWTAVPSDSWLEVVQAATTVAASGSSFTVAPGAASRAWPAGTYAGAVAVSASVHGVTVRRVVSVGYRPDALRLAVSDDAVALTSTATLATLRRSVRVSTNRGIPAAWTASADRPWLAVTPGGTTADPLVLTADPSLATAEVVSEATVTVTTGDPGFSDSVEAVKVGLWVSAVSPEAVTTVDVGYRELAADPLRPYVYVHAGGADVTVFNVYTGDVVGTIAGFGGSALGAMAVSGDGARLFAVDTPAPSRVLSVDLATGSPGPAWQLPLAGSAPRIASARTNGVPVLLTGGGSIHDPSTGASLATFTPPFGLAALGVSRSGSRFCVLTLGLSPYSVACRALDATASPGLAGAVLVGPPRSAGSGSNGGAVALSPDGTRAYVAAASPYEVTVYDPVAAIGEMPILGSLAADPFPDAVAVDRDGRVFAGLYAGGSGVRGWDAAGSPIGAWLVGDVTRGQLAVSGDGRRVVVLTGSDFTASSLKLVTVPPP